MGVEGAGTITETGEGVNGFAIGNRVSVVPVQSPLVGSGTYATHANIPASALVKSLDGTSAAKEASIWMAALQAYNLLCKVSVGAGDAVVVTAGTSPVGSALIQFAREMGATVFATTRTSERQQELLAVGAHHAIATDEEVLSEAVRGETAGSGVEIVFDTVDGAVLTQSILSLAERGQRVQLRRAVDAGHKCRARGCAARGSRPPEPVVRRSLELTQAPERFEAAKAYIRKVVASGPYQPLIDSVFKLDEVEQAHRRLDGGRLNGKIVLVTS
ncbi:zinc-binding dehydrogenase [Sphingobium phenoxybenzoativorans]|uniref:zinc-binding dehydrogenase n=1 Tax=Sphingobium phenoxybenzoativorans TaxID=1592790 RepID=UPI000871C08F|nr:zinc-binding dehydrogenase [Sphingobium phenoxybenzoativorans]